MKLWKGIDSSQYPENFTKPPPRIKEDLGQILQMLRNNLDQLIVNDEELIGG